MKYFFLIIHCVILLFTASSQQGTAKNALANQGNTIPRLTTSQRKNVASPNPGSLVYDTDKQSLYLFDGLFWNPLTTNNENEITPLTRYPVNARIYGFGKSVAVSGDLAAVGVLSYNGNGAVIIYKRNNGSWGEEHVISNPAAPNKDDFGSSVALNGTTLVIGAPGQFSNSSAHTEGCAYVFKQTASKWQLISKLKSEPSTPPVHTKTSGTAFGNAVSVSGNRIMIGEYRADIGNKPEQGCAYIYRLQEGIIKLEAKITSSDGTVKDNFGKSVSIDEEYAVAGAWGHSIGANKLQGAAYVFVYGGGTWIQMQKLFDSRGLESDLYGNSVSLSKNNLLIGAVNANSRIPSTAINRNHNGKAFIYTRKNNKWEYSWDYYFDTNATNAKLGDAVSISGDIALVSAPGSKYPDKKSTGFVYVFKKNPATQHWEFFRIIGDPLDLKYNNWLEWSVCTDGKNLILGNMSGDSYIKEKVVFLNLE